MISKTQVGFVYTIRHYRNGALLETIRQKNLMPEEGINHMLGLLAGGAQHPTWYIGLYGNDYTPQPTDKMLTFPSLAGEVSGYTGDRKAFVNIPVAGGTLTNIGNEAEFTFETNVTIHGGFMSSHQTKGSTSGVLLSAVQLPSPRNFLAGDTISVGAGLEISPL